MSIVRVSIEQTARGDNPEVVNAVFRKTITQELNFKELNYSILSGTQGVHLND